MTMRVGSNDGGSSFAPFFQIHDMQMQRQGSSRQKNSAATPSAEAATKKKRNRAGNPNPDAVVVALSPRTLMATNRFMCMVCYKGFQRDQNLQLHLRGHNLPWKLKQKNPMETRRRVYLCPEPTCVHHNPSRALGDLTGIKKHYCRKHGVKNLKCDKCDKRYAVESDWKAHNKTCGTREYRCDCDAVFSRKDTFIAHRAMCATVARLNGEMPPLGAGLFVGSRSNSNTLGLFSSSSSAAAQPHGYKDQAQSSSSAAEAASQQFDHAMASYPGSSSMFRSHQAASDFSPPFFLGDGGAPPTDQQALSEDDGGGVHSEGSQQAGLLPPHGKAPVPFQQHGLMMQQLPEQQYPYQYQYQPSSSSSIANNDVNFLNLAGFFSGNSGGASGSSHLLQGPLLHGKEPFHGDDMIQLPQPQQQQQHQPGSSSNANINLHDLAGFFQDARLFIQDQLFNGGGSNTEHGNNNVMAAASTGSHFGGGLVPSMQYNYSSSPPAALSATALLMKAAQMGSTSTTTRTHNHNHNGNGNGPSALLSAAGFTGAVVSGQQGTRMTAEEGAAHEAHFHDLIMNTLPLMGGTTGGNNAGMAGVDGGGSLSVTRDFLGNLDPAQMKWFI